MRHAWQQTEGTPRQQCSTPANDVAQQFLAYNAYMISLAKDVSVKALPSSTTNMAHRAPHVAVQSVRPNRTTQEATRNLYLTRCCEYSAAALAKGPRVDPEAAAGMVIMKNVSNRLFCTSFRHAEGMDDEKDTNGEQDARSGGGFVSPKPARALKYITNSCSPVFYKTLRVFRPLSALLLPAASLPALF